MPHFSLPFLCASALASAPATYINPVLGGDVPDPGVVAYGGLFYAFTTGGRFARHTSPDLGTWSAAGSLFDESTWPTWADGGTAWAPEVHLIPSTGRYVAYFVSRLLATGELCIGAAEGASPDGPFADRGAPLLRSPAGSCFGVIDPTLYWDEASSTSYVVFKEDGNSCGKPTNIYAASLDKEGTTVTGTWQYLITNDAPWEKGVTEAPWVMRNGTILYLFYSGSSYNEVAYAIGVARSTRGIAGPWAKYASNPVLHSAPGAQPDGQHYGPGHCSVVAVGGGWAMLYAAEEPGGSGRRNMLLDGVVWTADGWPVVAGGVPSNTTQPLPN
jgi:xylan 1,4-beta-xylosidase